MKPIQAGQLRHRVQFQQAAATPDAFGQPSTAWSTYYTCWADIEILSSQMLNETAEFVSKATYVVCIRWAGAAVQISAADRIVALADGTVYVIDTVTDIERRRRKLQILCHVLNEAD
jgi:SPP1 family predicted phage head-tail adaptor